MATFRRLACAMRRGADLLLLFAVTIAVSVSVPSGTASAHGGASGPHVGIAIPSLSHGEMAIIAPYYGRILALAASATDTTESFRRVLNFAQIQRAYCLWGVMPGSIGDEDSPFNECSHAYLAAAKLLLLQMRGMRMERNAAGELASEIDAVLVQSSLSLTLCRFSGESFDTAALVRPSLAGILHHGKSLAAVILAVMAAILLFRGAAGLVTMPPPGGQRYQRWSRR